MGDFNFGAANIYEFGETMSDTFRKMGVESGIKVEIPLDKDKFRKVDEDLFYRTRTDEKTDFIPSEGEIKVKVENINITIKESVD